MFSICSMAWEALAMDPVEYLSVVTAARQWVYEVAPADWTERHNARLASELARLSDADLVLHAMAFLHALDCDRTKADTCIPVRCLTIAELECERRGKPELMDRAWRRAEEPAVAEAPDTGAVGITDSDIDAVIL